MSTKNLDRTDWLECGPFTVGMQGILGTGGVFFYSLAHLMIKMDNVLNTVKPAIKGSVVPL